MWALSDKCGMPWNGQNYNGPSHCSLCCMQNEIFGLKTRFHMHAGLEPSKIAEHVILESIVNHISLLTNR
jgi:hypothetical protein